MELQLSIMYLEVSAANRLKWTLSPPPLLTTE